MIIDWTAAPEGTTHGMTVGRGEVRWYRVGDNVECWSVTIGWTQSFFLTKEEFNDAGLHLYEYGEQSELMMLREQRDALLAAVNMYETAFEGLFSVCLSNGVYNQWGRAVDCTSLNEAHRLGDLAIKKCAAVS